MHPVHNLHNVGVKDQEEEAERILIKNLQRGTTDAVACQKRERKGGVYSHLVWRVAPSSGSHLRVS